jgi:uncharacterized protein (DUF433 family)
MNGMADAPIVPGVPGYPRPRWPAPRAAALSNQVVGQWRVREVEVVERTRGPMRSPRHVIHSDPDILGGTPVFVGTRVPFRNLIDYLERGHSLDEFLDEFPSVSREQAVAALEAAHEAVSAGARPAR